MSRGEKIKQGREGDNYPRKVTTNKNGHVCAYVTLCVQYTSWPHTDSNKVQTR